MFTYLHFVVFGRVGGENMNYDDMPDWSYSDCYTGPYWSDCKVQASVKKGKNRPRSKLEYHSKRHDERYATNSSDANRYDADVEYYQNTRNLSYLPRFIGTLPLRFNHNKLRGSNSYGLGRNKIMPRHSFWEYLMDMLGKDDKQKHLREEREAKDEADRRARQAQADERDRARQADAPSDAKPTIPIPEPVVTKPTVYTGTCLNEPQQTYGAGGYMISNSNLSDLYRGRRKRRRRRTLM